MASGDQPTADQQPTVDERFGRIMEGLRTTLPGVQVLVAFLLTLPLQSRFEGLTTFQRNTYYVAFASALTASILLIAPSVHQRVRAPKTGVRRRSERHLMIAVRTTIAGTVLMAVAFVAAAMLVTSVLFTTPWAIATAAAFTLLTGWSWFLQPLSWGAEGP